MQELHVNTESDKKSIYTSLLPQISALMESDVPSFTNLSNCIAAFKQTFNWWWVGFYFVKGDELILGPFQGPVACTRIALGKGVCGASWQQQKTIVVPDVEKFPGHIACSALSKSEIVVPILKDGNVLAVLDVDSEHLAHFDEIDQHYLEEFCSTIAHFFPYS